MSCMRKRLAALAFIGCTVTLAASPTSADPAADFYTGKTIAISVGYAPGGIYDINARLVARHLTKYMPGHPNALVRNAPGAGGLTQANQLYNLAPRDGTEIGILARGAPQLAVMGEAGPRFDPAGFNWIGTSSSYRNDAYLLFARSDMGDLSVAGLRAGTRKLNFGADGPGSSNLIFGNIANDVLGIPLSTIKGYSGAAPIILAMRRGELDSTVMGISAIRAGQRDLLDSKLITPIVQFGRLTRHPDFPDAPTAREAAANESDRALIALAEAPFFMALPFAAPPGVPGERIAALRKAFLELHADPDYLSEAAKLDLDVSPLDGEAVQGLIRTMAATPPAVIERFKTIMSK